MIIEQVQGLTNSFEQQFGRKPTHAAIAPGRVNLIGEHTDYNDGFVLPMAIERHTIVLAAKRDDSEAHVKSTAFDDVAVFAVEPSLGKGEPSWSNYIRGAVAYSLEKGVNPGGFDALLESTVPAGGGLSSSASLEVATATLCEVLADKKLDPVEKALLCQKAEHNFAGCPCGIMDQFISALGHEGAALLIDCRSYETRQVKLDDPSVSILIINSNKSHELTGGEYAERRAQCEAGATALGVKALRDATIEQLVAAKDGLDDLTFRRAHHVITEIDRTVKAADAFDTGDYNTVGELMFASHESLSNDFQVSTPELDLLVELAKPLAKEGKLYGSRMTGGGFGGCTVTLVKTAHAEEVQKAITEVYEAKLGIKPSAFITKSAAGARELKLPTQSAN
ncbi:galactokinase [Poriferisphaera sp. WC338]|uniref:galactokinase n=1 Tax=Poriferisphaera sp. WC338 TaxID=3425129 RepID=UPI003D8147F8